MYQQKFVNRENELHFLESRYNSNSPEFIVIYGRRRVGKTELMLKFLENKQGIYFLASTEGDKQNIRDFSLRLGKVINDENFGKIEFSGWQSLFETLFKHRTFVSTSNQRAKIIATENTEITEDFFSVSSVLSVADKYKQ